MERIIKCVIWGIFAFCVGVFFFMVLSWPAMYIEAFIYPSFTSLGISNIPHYCMNNSPTQFTRDDYKDCLDFFEKADWITGGLMFVILIGTFYFYEQSKMKKNQ